MSFGVSKNYDVMVVGGGIVGLAAARRAAADGAAVLLVERATEIGGLLRSTRSPQGAWFDCGTHIPARTGRVRLDRLLFDDLQGIEWRSFTKLRKGNYFCGRVNERTQFPDVTNLPDEDYRKIFFEVLSRVADAPVGASLSEVLLSRYGNHLVETILAPLIERIYRTPLDSLSDRAHLFLALNRIVLADANVSRELKRSAIFDTKIAYADADEGAVAATYMYPRDGGCGAWIQALGRAAVQDGVDVCVGASVEALDATRRCAMVSGHAVEYGQLVWTAPIELLARLLDSNFSAQKPAFVPTRLYHFRLASRPAFDSHYICVNSPRMHSFRLTVYGNLVDDERDGRVTVEAIDYDGVANFERVVGELMEIGVLSDGGDIVEAISEGLGNGFPLLSLSALEGVEGALEVVRPCSGIFVVGRGKGDAFFMNDLLRTLDAGLDVVLKG